MTRGNPNAETVFLRALTALCAVVCWSVSAIASAQEVRGSLRYCIDPDWPPYEILNQSGEHEGIAADLLKLAAERAGVRLELVPTRDWDESLAAARDGRCQALSFLNSSPARDQWLDFTEPLLVDPNVIVTREEHGFVTDLADEGAKTMALPSGTAIEERVRRDFPNIVVVPVKSEAEAFALVSQGAADMTLRSLSVAVYTIKAEGWFNLKVAGQVPGYENLLRVGVRKDVAATMVPLLNDGIASLTSRERREILNGHVSIAIKTPINWWMVSSVAAIVVLLLLVLVQRSRLAALERDRALATLTLEHDQRQEAERFLSMLTHELKRPMSVLRLALGMAKLPPRHRGFADGAIMDMDALLDHCLQVDRLDRGWITVAHGECPVDGIAAEAAAMCGQSERVGLDIADRAVLYTDGVLLRGILVNLLDNAVKYSPPGTPVVLSVRAERRDGHDGVCFTVENVPGPAGHPDPARVFERYYRAPLARKLSGSGLGLYLVRGLAQTLGGRAELVPDPKMVRFDLWMPS